MPNTIVSTEFSLPQAVISNGVITGNQFTDTDNVLLPDSDFAISDVVTGSASDFIVGNFDFLSGGLPSDAIITGFEIKIRGKRGAQTVPPITLDLYAVDNTSGTNVYYPYTSGYTGLTTDNDDHILGGQNYLFDTTWDADKANNFKLALVANGDISLDTVWIKIYYYIASAATPPTPVPSGCIDCNSPIQVQSMRLALPFLIGDTKFYLQKGSFAYADGTPVQPGDVGTCGGTIDFVFDQDLRRSGSGNFAENVKLDVSTGSWSVLPSGIIEVDIADVTNRGLDFKTPYDHDADRMSDHNANSEVVISNSGSFYSRFVRACQVDIVFSPPIDVFDEGTEVVTAVHEFNFIGDNVQAEQDAGDPQRANITVLTNPTNVNPTIEDTSTGTTGTTPAIDLTFQHTITNANYLTVWISTDNETINSVTYDGVAMTLIDEQVNTGGDLKVAMYELVNPNVGTHDIVVTMNAVSNITAGGVSYIDVNTADPSGAVSAGSFGSDEYPTDSITTTTQNAVVQDVVGATNNPTTFTQSGLWTIQAQVNAALRTGASSTRTVLSPHLVNDVYTIAPASDWAMLMVEIKGQVIASSGVQSVTDDGNGVVNVNNTDPVNPVIEFDQAQLETDLAGNIAVAVDGVTITGDGTTGNPLVAVGGGGGSASDVSVDITQTAHGFSVGDVVRSSGTDGEFTLAQADTSATAEVTGIVSSVPNANEFTIITEGFVTLTSLPGGATSGDILFLSDSVAGALTLTEPTTVGYVTKPLAEVIDVSQNIIYFHNYRGKIIPSGGAGSGGISIPVVAGEDLNGTTNPLTTFVGENVQTLTLSFGISNADYVATIPALLDYTPVGTAISGSTYVDITNKRYAISFTPASNVLISGAAFRGTCPNNNATHNITIEIDLNAAGAPAGTPIYNSGANAYGTPSSFTQDELFFRFNDTVMLTSGTTYWFIIEKAADVDPLSINPGTAGTMLEWDGANWIAAGVSRLFFELFLIPFRGNAYRSYVETSGALAGGGAIVGRNNFVGFYNGNAVQGDSISVIHDGVIGTFASNLNGNYFLTTSLGGVATTGTTKVGYGYGNTDIVVSRNAGVYQ